MANSSARPIPKIDPHETFAPGRKSERTPVGGFKSERERANPMMNKGSSSSGADAVPGVEITVTQVGEETAKPGNAAQDKEPPGPRLTLTQGKFRQPHVKRANRDERPAKGDSIVEHEMDHAAIVDAAELFRGNSQKLHVVWQELLVDGKEQGEAAAEYQD